MVGCDALDRPRHQLFAGPAGRHYLKETLQFAGSVYSDDAKKSPTLRRRAFPVPSRAESMRPEPCDYHHSISRGDITLALLFGFGVRSSRTGHEASFITFSVIDPKTEGYQPERPCVEITT